VTTADRGRALAPLFERVAAETDLDAALLMGIAQVESGFRRDAVNPSSGAAGLMQVMPLHFARWGWTRPTSIDQATRTGVGGWGWSDPLQNIRAGATILAEQLSWRGGDMDAALAGYGGHVSTDPAPYLAKVYGAAAQWGGPLLAGSGSVGPLVILALVLAAARRA
jgi:soluble lytic murein transglycosylase-like protein